ncbi:MAG: hypothetical protein IJB55_05200 [Firmicutes bacterium]|nr:hypothetical protein [Bacillota bacterium]
MIMFTMTAPRRKLKRALQAGGMVLLLAAVVPAIYSSLTEAEAMSSFADAGAAAADSTESAENAGNSGNAGNSESADGADSADGEVSAAGADTAGATDNTEGAGPETAAVEEEGTGLLDALREVLFGPERQIEMY